MGEERLCRDERIQPALGMPTRCGGDSRRTERLEKES